MEKSLTVLKISTVGASVLRQKAKNIQLDENTRKIAADMSDTMKAAGGLGLAAPQVGISIRLVIIDFGYLKYEIPSGLGVLGLVLFVYCVEQPAKRYSVFFI